MEPTTHHSPEQQPTSDIYRTFVQGFGIESSLADSYLNEQRSIAAQDISTDRLSLNDFRKQQNELYEQNRDREITEEELFAAIATLQARRQQTHIFDDATQMLAEYPYHARIEAGANETVVAQVNELLTKTRSLADSIAEHPAPFRAFADNTSDSWEYVDHQLIADTLKSKPFVDYRELAASSRNARSATYLHGTGSGSLYLFEIPTRLMVNAAGFESWLGRSDNYGNEGRGDKAISLPKFSDPISISINAIKAYASHPDRLPYVGQAEIFIQPNGLAFAGNGSGDSHRISAAILRGQETVQARNIIIKLLKEDYFPN